MSRSKHTSSPKSREVAVGSSIHLEGQHSNDDDEGGKQQQELHERVGVVAKGKREETSAGLEDDIEVEKKDVKDTEEDVERVAKDEEEEDGLEIEVEIEPEDLEEKRRSGSESGHLALDRLEQGPQNTTQSAVEGDDDSDDKENEREADRNKSWPWLRAAIDRVRGSPKCLAIAYLCFLLLAAVFGALVFVDVDDVSSRADAWIASFGVATLLALVAAALLLVEPAKDTGFIVKLSWLDTLTNALKENHNANRLFVLFEAMFDIVLAATNLRQSAAGLPEYDTAVTAIVAAAMALCFTVVDIALFYRFRGEIEFVRTQRTTEPLWETVRTQAEKARAKAGPERYEEENMAIRADEYVFRCLFYPVYNVAFILALILSDLADILLLSRSAVVMQFETKELLLYVFLLSNVLVSEVFTGVANLFESFATRVRLSDMEYGPERTKVEEELASAAALRTSLRRKANVQTTVTGLVVIPLVIAVALHVGSMVTGEDVCAIVMPFLLLACANLVLASAEFGCGASTAADSWLVKASGCMLAYVRVVQMSPRLLAGTWGVVLGHTDIISVRTGIGAGADRDVQSVIFDLYVVYMFVPLWIRLLSDMLRCRGLCSTIRKHGDFEGRALTDTDFLCIGRYALSIEKKDPPERQVRLDDTYPTRVSLSLLCYGLSTWKAQQNEDRVYVSLGSNVIGTRGAKVLSTSLATNSSVHTLNLERNGFRDTGAQALGEGLKNNEALRLLDLRSNIIGPKGAQHLAEGLKVNITLLELTLRDNMIGNDGTAALAQALEHNQKLEYLDLSENRIGDIGAAVLGEGLVNNETLWTLNLQGNWIGGIGARALGKGLIKNTALRTLNLRSNQIGDDGAKALGNGLRENETLETLNLSGNEIGDDGAKAIGQALEMNKESALKELYLNGGAFDDEAPKIGDDGAIALADALKGNTTLQVLILSENHIGNAGAKAIGRALAENKKSALRLLQITSNRIGVESAKVFADMLQTNDTLREIDGMVMDELSGKVPREEVDLSYKFIGDFDVALLTELIKNNAFLKVLNLTSNKIGDDGAAALGEGLASNETMQTLNLADNEVGDEGAKALGDGLKENKTLAELDLQSNRVGPEGAEHFAVALKVNTTLQYTLPVRKSF